MLVNGYGAGGAVREMQDNAFDTALSTSLAAQNLPVRPLYTPGPIAANFNLRDQFNHAPFLNAIIRNDVVTIDEFLHPQNRFDRMKILGREAIYYATLQSNSSLVEQLISRGVRYAPTATRGLPRTIREAIAYAEANKAGDPELVIIERLLLNNIHRT